MGKKKESLPGFQKKQAGFVPGFPVILIPGFVSSSLKVIQTEDPDFKDQRIWVNLSLVGLKYLSQSSNSSSNSSIDDTFSGLNSLLSNPLSKPVGYEQPPQSITIGWVSHRTGTFSYSWRKVWAELFPVDGAFGRRYKLGLYSEMSRAPGAKLIDYQTLEGSMKVEPCKIDPDPKTGVQAGTGFVVNGPKKFVLAGDNKNDMSQKVIQLNTILLNFFPTEQEQQRRKLINDLMASLASTTPTPSFSSPPPGSQYPPGVLPPGQYPSMVPQGPQAPYVQGQVLPQIAPYPSPPNQMPPQGAPQPQMPYQSPTFLQTQQPIQSQQPTQSQQSTQSMPQAQYSELLDLILNSPTSPKLPSDENQQGTPESLISPMEQLEINPLLLHSEDAENNGAEEESDSNPPPTLRPLVDPLHPNAPLSESESKQSASSPLKSVDTGVLPPENPASLLPSHLPPSDPALKKEAVTPAALVGLPLGDTTVPLNPIPSISKPSPNASPTPPQHQTLTPAPSFASQAPQQGTSHSPYISPVNTQPTTNAQNQSLPSFLSPPAQQSSGWSSSSQILGPNAQPQQPYYQMQPQSYQPFVQSQQTMLAPQQTSFQSQYQMQPQPQQMQPQLNQPQYQMQPQQMQAQQMPSQQLQQFPQMTQALTNPQYPNQPQQFLTQQMPIYQPQYQMQPQQIPGHQLQYQMQPQQIQAQQMSQGQQPVQQYLQYQMQPQPQQMQPQLNQPQYQMQSQQMPVQIQPQILQGQQPTSLYPQFPLQQGAPGSIPPGQMQIQSQQLLQGQQGNPQYRLAPAPGSNPYPASAPAPQFLAPPQTPQDKFYNRAWLKHMALMDDGFSDPPGIKVRPIPGSQGCDYLAASSLKLLSEMSYIFGPLLENLKEVGYQEDTDYICAPYDWRIPPHVLQLRDSYFTYLKNLVLYFVARHQKKVVFVCHSMGNKVFSYFLLWAEKELGTKWLEDHIQCWIAAGAPWLGSPKSLRTSVSGEKGGLEFALYDDEGLALMRSFGSTPWLYPIGLENYFEEETRGATIFTWMKNDVTGEYVPKNVYDILKESGAFKSAEMFQKFYLENEFFAHGEKLKKPPPITTHVLYGINVTTECFYFYERAPKGSRIPLLLSPTTSNPTHRNGYTVKKGIAYETKSTPQKILRELNAPTVFKCGDGTVPYCSLAYPLYWEKEVPDRVFVREIEGCDHRTILKDDRFTHFVLEKICFFNAYYQAK